MHFFSKQNLIIAFPGFIKVEIGYLWEINNFLILMYCFMHIYIYDTLFYTKLNIWFIFKLLKITQSLQWKASLTISKKSK